MGKIKEYKTGTLSIRFDKKIRFKLELAARIRRISLSAFILDCCLEKMSNMDIKINISEKEINFNLDKLADKIWNINADKRLLNLQKIYPSLLTYDEDIYLDKIAKKGERAE